MVTPSRSSCREFCKFIEDADFIESPTTGLYFTWSGRRFLPRHIESRLDRALFSSGFDDMWTNIVTHALPRLTSDHSALVLQCRDAAPPGKRSFRFLNMWVLHPDFHNLVHNSWSGDVDVRCPIFKVMFKLRRLCADLKTWNRTVFGHVDEQIVTYQAALLEIQQRISQNGYSDSVFDEEIQAQARLNIILERKNSLLHQKSRAKWLTDGDRNTSFFHHLIKFRKPKEEGPGRDDRTMLEAIIDHSVTEEQNANLIRIPEDEEVKASVFGMDASSAPGPDGFSGLFFQNCWSIIKEDICFAVRAFFLHSYLPAGCNASTLILIPKKDQVDTVADLRPIILSNFFFKIISKLLATRLSAAAAVCVTPNQFGFISGRSIHDCIVLGSEGFNCMNRTGRRSNFACKIDIRKAFDTMSWGFILQVLQVNGFHETFIRWISVIFTSARISILYNGQLSGYFACSRGVRQGDPLSPILFGIAEDVLSHLFLNCVHSRHLVPMDFSRGSHFPTHLLYADDILIFCKASVRNAKKIKEILNLYGELSGQVCNPLKSHVYFSSKVATPLRNNIKRELGFAIGSSPITYLGVPLFTGRIRATYFMAIYDKIINKFARWKGLQLSMAGRICLVRLVIQSSVTHSMMIYRWPKSLIYNLDKKCRNFIWTGSVDIKPSCPVSWNRIYAPRAEGGLGVQSFSTMNKSYLMKMAWKMVQGQDFAFAVLRTRYLTLFGYAKLNIASSPYWTGIREHVNQLVDNSFSYVGKGSTTYFWKDDWLGYKLVDKLRIPTFMHEFLNQAIDDYFFDGIWHFTEDFIIHCSDIVVDILLLPFGEEEDQRFWKSSLTGEVSAALAFAANNHCFPKVCWGSWIWEKFIPEHRSLLTWRLIHRRLPTQDILIRHGKMVGPNRCALCGRDEETISHLFWRCSEVKLAWHEFLEWFHKIEYLHQADIHDFLVIAWNAKFSSLVTSFWKVGVINLLWKIWDCRNQVIFEDKSFSPRDLSRFLKVAFKEMDAHFSKMGTSNNSWSDYLILRSVGVASRAAPPPVMVNVHWWPPVGPWIKVNTDGSAMGAPGSIAAGGVFRDHWGWVRGCFHFKGGTGFAFEAELLAVIYAIMIAHHRGWYMLWIESDSAYIVRLLNSRSLDVPWHFMATWRKALKLLEEFQVQVSHIFHEGNCAADLMANPARTEGWWPYARDEIKNAVAMDMANHSHVRIKGMLLCFLAAGFYRTDGGRVSAWVLFIRRLEWSFFFIAQGLLSVQRRDLRWNKEQLCVPWQLKVFSILFDWDLFSNSWWAGLVRIFWMEIGIGRSFAVWFWEGCIFGDGTSPAAMITLSSGMGCGGNITADNKLLFVSHGMVGRGFLEEDGPSATVYHRLLGSSASVERWLEEGIGDGVLPAKFPSMTAFSVATFVVRWLEEGIGDGVLPAEFPSMTAFSVATFVVRWLEEGIGDGVLPTAFPSRIAFSDRWLEEGFGDGVLPAGFPSMIALGVICWLLVFACICFSSCFFFVLRSRDYLGTMVRPEFLRFSQLSFQHFFLLDEYSFPSC
ncbi:uncharacterized protein LOC131025643 [Salvia miltiorrhiza]|uniref:uncharacterized protein LOC131025643 n=1 Tax=Salvia miltiorrhiza TaxID=226208 RepID=UPI0025AB73CE|nr:uncharacterized protein LOC131025643 [Salvia miltiorrhiza]